MPRFSECIPLLPVSAKINLLGNLEIAGCDLTDLVNKFDSPLYIYDGATIRNQLMEIQKWLPRYPGEWEITYAGKAYFSLGIARKLAQMGLGVDVVSQSELRIAQKAGFNPEHVHLHGNNKSLSALALALEWGIHSIVIDSLEELEFLSKTAAKMDKIARIWLRITPGLEIDDIHPYVQTASSSSKFGLAVRTGAAAQAIQRAKVDPRLNLTGLHIHLGSQIYSGAPYQKAIKVLVELAEKEGIIPTEISPGGGWGQPYTPEQVATARPVSEWIDAISDTVVEEFSRRNWPFPKVLIEPGRFLVARSAVAVYRVGTTKFGSDGTYFISVDGGLADNPRPALYNSQYTAIMVNAPEANFQYNAHIVGMFCESGDELIKGIPMPQVKRGDLLAIPVAGAYQLSMSSNYNLAPRPAAIWLEDGKAQELQKREDPAESGWWIIGEE